MKAAKWPFPALSNHHFVIPVQAGTQANLDGNKIR